MKKETNNIIEIWKDIREFEGLYQISNLGRIKSFYGKKERYLKPIKDKDGYLQIKIYKNTKQYTAKIHRLVAKAFIPNPDNLPEVNHKDENKLIIILIILNGVLIFIIIIMEIKINLFQGLLINMI